MRTIRSRQGDTADLIAHREWGDAALVDLLLAANRGLAAQGPIIATGTRITLPERRPPPTAPTVTLW